MPSLKEVEEHNFDNAAFRSWCPRCVMVGAVSCERKIDKDKEVDYSCVRSEQEQEEEMGTPADCSTEGQQGEDDHGEGWSEQGSG